MSDDKREDEWEPVSALAKSLGLTWERRHDGAVGGLRDYFNLFTAKGEFLYAHNPEASLAFLQGYRSARRQLEERVREMIELVSRWQPLVEQEWGAISGEDFDIIARAKTQS